jgi:hypothetical protein
MKSPMQKNYRIFVNSFIKSESSKKKNVLLKRRTFKPNPSNQHIRPDLQDGITNPDLAAITQCQRI